MQSIDALSYQSRWCQVKPERKFALYCIFMLLAMSLPPLGQALLLLAIVSLTCYLLPISPRRYLTWLSVPLVFLLFSLLGILFSLSQQPETLLWHVAIGNYWLGISPESVVSANHVFWRSLASLSATLWFVLNMPFEQLIVLLKRGRVPILLIEQILLTWRFIFIFLEEAAAIYRAQHLRFGYCSVRRGYRSLAMLISMLLTRVLSRYQQMSIALKVKLYQGDFHL